MANRFLGIVSCCVLLLVGVLIGPPAQSRTLTWEALDVDATLDRDGRLHVVERHTIIFDGAWNGGERQFRVTGDQQLTFLGMFEIDPLTEARQELHSGNLSAIGQYRFFDDHLLRWRARMPKDPPFNHAVRIYELKYELSKIIFKTEGTYRLNHDFAFPNRGTDIEHFSANLTLDPAWNVSSDSSLHLQRDHLPPGEGAVLNLKLSHSGNSTPSELVPTRIERIFDAVASAFSPHSEPWRFIALLATMLLIFVRAALWYRHDVGFGKIVLSIANVDRQWIESNLLRYAPEYVGAAWDLATSSNEVAAVIARMTLEGKIESRIISKKVLFWNEDVLELTLCTQRNALKGYELTLINALFFDGNTTDTERFREHYKNTGFDPAAKILMPAMKARIAKLVADEAVRPSFGWIVTTVLLTSAGLCALQGIFQAYGDVQITFAFAIALIFLLVMGAISAATYRTTVTGLLRQALKIFAWIALVLLITTMALLGSVLQMPPLPAIAMTLAALGIVNSYFNRMEYRGSPDALRIRKSFEIARRYFSRELKSRTPNLDDAWYPYVLAFGLGRDADRWLKVHGKSNSTIADDTSDSRFGSPSCSPGCSTVWQGGGGVFGGAGASVSWAAAVSGIAESIPSPGSSGDGSSGGSDSGGGGSSSGGGDGGSSSGGGGGGGW